MGLDCDVALLGTGVAPLIAASYLLSQGKSVLLLNPDWDFFLEDSELPLDPLLGFPRSMSDSARAARSRPESVLDALRPYFPGAVEFWNPSSTLSSPGKSGFHDPQAPHVRGRSRLWISGSTPAWEQFEDFYVEASDRGLNPQILEGLQAKARFPGMASKTSEVTDEIRGFMLPQICDVDVSRYRVGLLEFIRERLGSERMISHATQIEWMPGGIRFRSGKTSYTARLSEGMLAFWTPRLTSWVLSECKRLNTVPRKPVGVRLWEQWLLISRDLLDPAIIGVMGNTLAWAELEGVPSRGSDLLSVLRAGPLLALDAGRTEIGNWASSESFGDISSLCHGFLKWDRFSVRAIRTRAIFEWKDERPFLLSEAGPKAHVIPGCDGPLMDVARVARQAADLVAASAGGTG